MTEFEQIKQYVEMRMKANKDMMAHDSNSNDKFYSCCYHEDMMILSEIEEIIAKRDTIESDN